MVHSGPQERPSIPTELEEKLAVARQALNDAAIAMMRGSGVTLSDRVAVQTAWRDSDPTRPMPSRHWLEGEVHRLQMALEEIDALRPPDTIDLGRSEDVDALFDSAVEARRIVEVALQYPKTEAA